jgi:CheY-like chemotaxis protein
MPTLRKILIVEDDTIIVMMLKMCYEFLDCEVVGTVDTGESAIEFLATTQVDLISMDIMLNSAMTGIEAVRLLREAGNNTPVIFISANDDFEAQTRAVVQSTFLPKPLGLDELTLGLQHFYPPLKMTS